MEFCMLDPHDLRIDKTNERRSNPGSKTDGGDLEKSIAERGVLDPIHVREVDDELNVIAGQRRTLAAQAVGLDKIPAIKLDVDESEARAISMIENDEQLRKQVPRKDRARATRAYVNEVGGTDVAAEKLGVTQQTIVNRLETTRSFWKGTEFYAHTRSEKETEDIPNQLLARIRSVTNDGEDGEEVAVQIKEDNIPRNIVDSALSNADSRSELETELEQRYYRDDEDKIEFEVELEFEGDTAQTLANFARDRGTSREEAARQLLDSSLDEMDEHKPMPEDSTKLSEFST